MKWEGFSEKRVGSLTLSTLPQEVLEAITKINLWGNALDRALAGASWLDRNAPPDWRLQMMSIHDGIIHSIVRFQRDTENPLALAFRRDTQFRRNDDRVSWATVSKKFFDGARGHEAQLLGFLEKEHQIDHVVINTAIDAEFLNGAWEQVLRELSWHEIVASYREKERV